MAASRASNLWDIQDLHMWFLRAHSLFFGKGGKQENSTEVYTKKFLELGTTTTHLQKKGKGNIE